jgi:SAM-dependent methyltransferase
MQCNCCQSPLGQHVYISPGNLSVTSLREVYPTRTEVYFCPTCTHLQTPQSMDLAAYYDQTYKMLIDSEDEDQLYEVAGGRKIFRYPHQADTLLRKVCLPPQARILDYGCAKGTTLRHLLARRPDLQPHLFDVSRMYLPFWEKFVTADNWALYELKEEWFHSFDMVTSFFVLEHTAQPLDMLTTVRKLLKPGGIHYCIVPNVYTNVCDFVVADHVNHFSPASMRAVLRRAGFEALEIDDSAHQSAFVVIARNARACEPKPPTSQGVATVQADVEAMAQYWTTFTRKLRAFEEAQGSQPSAIYGSGFYGTFIMTSLAHHANVVCFVDRNPYLQGKTLLDKPIVAPEQLPAHVRVVYVGLNPAIAAAEMAKLPAWADRPLQYYYL